MTCEETRDLLAGYVAGELGDEAQAVAAHLAACEACAAEEASLRLLLDDLQVAGDAFRPRLLPPALTLARAATQARRRRLTLVAAAAMAAAVAALAVALALPATARHLPLPAGHRLAQLDDRVAALEAGTNALNGELSRVDAELALRRQLGRSVILRTTGVTPRRQTRVLRSVAAFFAARAGLALPGAAGREARTRLATVTVPGSPAASETVPLPLAVTAASQGSGRLRHQGTVVVVSRVRLLTAGKALVYVRAFDYGSRTVSQSSTGGPRTRTYWRESVHRLVVVRSPAGRWLVAEDLSSLQPAGSVPAPAAGELASGPSPAASPSGGMGVTRPSLPALGSPTPSPTQTTTSVPTGPPTSSPTAP